MTPESGARTAAYGSWSSPITTDLLVAGAVGLHEVQSWGDHLWWDEARPEEGGRVQLVRCWFDGEEADGSIVDVLPDGFAARTRVHEYGGGAWRAHGDTVYFSNWSDQRLYRLEVGGEPVALTPKGCRYADMDIAPDGSWLVTVREDHRGAGEEKNEIVRIDTTSGEEAVLVTGPDFVASPRLDDEGRRLAWTQWDHPDMPWDAAELWVGELETDGVVEAHRLAGGRGEWASEPFWAPLDGTLWFTSDRDGFARLQRWHGSDEIEAVANVPDGEVATPPWVFRMSRFVPAAGMGWSGDTWCLVAISQGGIDRMYLVDPDSDRTTALGDPYTAISSLAPVGAGAVAVAASFSSEPAIVHYATYAGPHEPDDDIPTLTPEAAERWVEDVRAEGGEVAAATTGPGRHNSAWPGGVDAYPLREPRDLGLSPEQISLPESIDFPSADGRTAHALYYPPTNPDHEGPDGEKPPLLVDIHGGPTGAVRSQFQLGIQFWTSRGFAVVDVNYGGSTGYGRAYRDLLKGQWGVVDVEDCVAAAEYMANRGDVDPARMAIRGGSAGGFTALAALAFHDTFAAGMSEYGVADLAVLAQETHKFESRYLDSLIGPWPEAEALYHERSPLFHADGIRVPLLVLQGLEDEVVPPNQAEMIVDALKANCVPVAYLAFEGEQHGFRKAETIVRAAEAELSFYGQVFGFDPVGVTDPVELT